MEFEVKASLGRRWLGCEIHGTERAVDSVRAPTGAVRAGCVRILSGASGQGERFVTGFRP